MKIMNLDGLMSSFLVLLILGALISSLAVLIGLNRPLIFAVCWIVVAIAVVDPGMLERGIFCKLVVVCVGGIISLVINGIFPNLDIAITLLFLIALVIGSAMIVTGPQKSKTVEA